LPLVTALSSINSASTSRAIIRDERRLARTWWPPKDEAYGLLLGDNLAQNLGIAQQVCLAYHGIERLWAQPLG